MISSVSIRSLVKGKTGRVVVGFSWWDFLEEPDDVSDCESESRAVVSAVPVVSDVLASPSSVVTECFDDVSLDPDWEFVESQSFFFLQEASVRWDLVQEIVRYEGSPEKASPLTRRRMMPSTPQQSSYSSCEEWQWQTEIWSVREREVMAKMEDYLNKHCTSRS